MPAWEGPLMHSGFAGRTAKSREMQKAPERACKHLHCIWPYLAPSLAWHGQDIQVWPKKTHAHSLTAFGYEFSIRREGFKETTRMSLCAADLPEPQVNEPMHVVLKWHTALPDCFAHLSPKCSPTVWRKVGRLKSLYIDSLIMHPCVPCNKSPPFWKGVGNSMENHISHRDPEDNFLRCL